MIDTYAGGKQQKLIEGIRCLFRFLFLFVLMDAILLNLNLQKKGHHPDVIFQLCTLLSNKFEANIRKLEGYFLFHIHNLSQGVIVELL